MGVGNCWDMGMEMGKDRKGGLDCGRGNHHCQHRRWRLGSFDVPGPLVDNSFLAETKEDCKDEKNQYCGYCSVWVDHFDRFPFVCDL